MKVTIRDVSDKTGLSASTISRVLSGNGYVKEDTRNLVETVVKELGYKSARHRKGSPSNQVVLILVDDITNLFYAEIIRGIDDALSALNIKVLLCNSDGNTQKEEEYVAFANASRFFGVIMVTATETENLVQLLGETVTPVVMVNRYLRSRDCDAVCIDNYRGGYLATQYLLDMNHTKISHLAGPFTSSASYDRSRGYIDALADRGIVFDESMVYSGNLKRSKGYEYAEYFVKNHLDFTAVFCANVIMARAFIERITTLGLQVPRDVSVIAFDETQDAIHGGIPITNVSKDPYDMGAAAAQLLLERVSQPYADVRKVIFAPQLKVRESVRQLDISALENSG